MKKMMDWLEGSFQPKMQKIVRNPWIAALSSSMQKILPFILVGALIFFYNVFRSWIPVLPDLSNILLFTFQMVSLVLVFMVANQLMQNLGHSQYTINAAIVALIVYIIFSMPVIDENSIMNIDFSKFGPSGMFVAMVVGMFVGLIYHLYAKMHVLENNVSLPDFVTDWINQMVPIFISIAAATLLVFNVNVDLYTLILKFFEPIQSFGFTLPGLIVMMLSITFLYTLGISTWFLGAITTPILLAGTAANMAAAAAGEPIPYIVCYETIYSLCFMVLGGTGCTLPLNIMMMRSKSKKLKTVGRICIGPSIFNINEPVVFGAPVVFNPVLMIPMWLNAVVGCILTWIPMSMGLLDIPAATLTTGQVPAPFGYLILTGDFRVFIFYVITFVIFWLIWLPFFKTYEKQILTEEQAVIENEN